MTAANHWQTLLYIGQLYYIMLYPVHFAMSGIQTLNVVVIVTDCIVS